MSTPSVGPVGVDAVRPIPHGRTARRLTWPFLPPELREHIEQQLGWPVTEHASQDSGFTPGFASVVHGPDGQRVFLKAANRTAQAPFAEAYAVEAHVVRRLGDSVPAPRLLWHLDGEWVVLAFEAADARAPKRPWLPGELARALDLATAIAESTRELPEGLDLNPLHQDLPTFVTGWDTVRRFEPDWPHLDEADALARSFAELPADRFVHADLRDDNILLVGDTALACDWNWPGLGPAWLDVVVLLISAAGDGLDPEPLLAEHPLTRGVAADHIDAWLAAYCGFMLDARELPVPSTSPHLRDHARWYAEASWTWLAARRGWS